MTDNGIRVFQSNRLESLIETFHERLFGEGADPFCRRLVIVPSRHMKSWLQQRLAMSRGIATGMEILTQDSALSRLVAQLCPHTKGVVPSRLEMSLALELIIQDLLAKEPQMTPVERKKWNPVFGLLDDVTSSVRQRRRITSLSEELASLFESYGKHSIRILEAWRQQEDLGWQENLWLLLHRIYPEWCPWAHYMSADIITPQQPLPHVALFGISYIAPFHQRFLQRVSQFTTVDYYRLEPCQHYSGDIQTEREASHFSKRLKRAGVPKAQVEAMEKLLRDTNPLLANLGRLGRVMTQQLEESQADIDGRFYLSDAAMTLPAYANHVTQETVIVESPAPLDLLAALQADLLLLRNPTLATPLALNSADTSLQLHVAPSRQREIEALYNTLLGLIASNPAIAPSDILVMAPDISLYQIAISAVFGTSYSQLSYQISDLPVTTQNAFAQAFFCLLDLAKSRWDALTVVQLLNNPYFAAKHHLTSDDLERIRRWIDDSHITWGKNADHRNHLLRRAHCLHDMTSDAYVGTWHHGFNRLLCHLATGDQSETSAQATFGDADLLSRWLDIMNSLWLDLQPLMTDATMTIADWATYVECLCDGYLTPTDNHSQLDRDALFQMFNQLRQPSRSIPEARFSYSSIGTRLEALFHQANANKQENALQTIRFGSLQSLSSLPAAIIVILGLDEGAYPRIERPRALDILRHHPDTDPLPTLMDQDRYHFLEAILSAREHLIISYTSICEDDGKEQGPSVAIRELLSYLNRHYIIGDDSIATHITYHHPFYPFDTSYFSKSRKIIGYSEYDYEAAKALQECHYAASPFLPELITYHHPIESETPSIDILDISDMAQAAKNPLKLYLNKSLQLYLTDIDKSAIAIEESFKLSALDRYQIEKELLSCSLEETMRRHREQGDLPLGPFGEVAKSQLLEMAAERQQAWNAFETTPNELFHLELALNCTKPEPLSENLWRIPAPEIQLPDGKTIKIIGKLSDLTPKGLLSPRKRETKSMVRSWPLLLLMNHLKPIIEDIKQTHIAPQVLFFKDSKTSKVLTNDTTSALSTFAGYAVECLHRPSLLIDDWVEDFSKHSTEQIIQELPKKLEKEEFYNQEAQWLFQHGLDLLNNDFIHYWQRKNQEIYEEALSNLKADKR